MENKFEINQELLMLIKAKLFDSTVALGQVLEGVESDMAVAPSTHQLSHSYQNKLRSVANRALALKLQRKQNQRYEILRISKEKLAATGIPQVFYKKGVGSTILAHLLYVTGVIAEPYVMLVSDGDELVIYGEPDPGGKRLD